MVKDFLCLSPPQTPNSLDFGQRVIRTDSLETRERERRETARERKANKRKRKHSSSAGSQTAKNTRA